MIHVIANIDIKPGTREAFLEAVRALVPDVRAEQGCIAYGPAVDVRADVRRQIPFRENTVTIVERWESLDALKAHLAKVGKLLSVAPLDVPDRIEAIRNEVAELEKRIAERDAAGPLSADTLLEQAETIGDATIVVAEAALCGVPAVVSRDSGLVEAVIEDETALVVPPDDPDATAKAIARLLSNDDLRLQMGSAARRYALENATWERRVQVYDEILQRITVSAE